MDFCAQNLRVTSIHEFAKSCFSLSDAEAEALQAKLEEAEAQSPAALRRQLAQLSADGAGVLDAEDNYLKCMQLELLTYLSTGGDSTHLVTSGAGTELLASARLLETFLSAGTCDQAYGWGFGGVVYYHEDGNKSGVSDRSKETVHERWAEAFKVLLRIGEKYEDIVDDNIKLNLAVGTALAFHTPVRQHADGKLIDALERFEYFWDRFTDGALVDTFAECTAWQMRYIVGSWASHDEMDWAREHCTKTIRSARQCTGWWHTGSITPTARISTGRARARTTTPGPSRWRPCIVSVGSAAISPSL